MTTHAHDVQSALVNIPSFFLDETYAPSLLKAKALKLAETRSDPSYRSKFANGLSTTTTFKRAIIRPMKLLFLSPIVSLLSLHM